MGFNTSSVWIKVALVCLLLGALLFIIGFATVAWMVQGNRYNSHAYGLWREQSCRSGICASAKVTERWMEYNNIKGSYMATRVFECIGLVCQLLALFIIILFIFVDSIRKRSPLIAIIILCFVGAVCMAIGFIIFATEFDFSDVGWSMGVAIGGCCLTFIAGVMAVLDLKR